jgi:hypothetical protein
MVFDGFNNYWKEKESIPRTFGYLSHTKNEKCSASALCRTYFLPFLPSYNLTVSYFLLLGSALSR